MNRTQLGHVVAFSMGVKSYTAERRTQRLYTVDIDKLVAKGAGEARRFCSTPVLSS